MLVVSAAATGAATFLAEAFLAARFMTCFVADVGAAVTGATSVLVLLAARVFLTAGAAVGVADLAVAFFALTFFAAAFFAGAVAPDLLAAFASLIAAFTAFSYSATLATASFRAAFDLSSAFFAASPNLAAAISSLSSDDGLFGFSIFLFLKRWFGEVLRSFKRMSMASAHLTLIL